MFNAEELVAAFEDFNLSPLTRSICVATESVTDDRKDIGEVLYQSAASSLLRDVLEHMNAKLGTNYQDTEKMSVLVGGKTKEERDGEFAARYSQPEDPPHADCS